MPACEPEDAIVLIVEDNIDNLFIIQEMLRARVKVKAYNGVASGKQLFQLLEEKPDMQPNLILLDLQMPYEDGYSILQKLRAMPRLKDVPVVAVTANVMSQDVDRTREAGFNGFIGKPFDRYRFPDQIKRILSGEAIWEPR